MTGPHAPPHDAHGAACGAKGPAAFRLLQEKWVLPIVWTLLGGPRGFNDLLRTLGGAGPTTLAGRLDRLEAAGVVERSVQSISPPRTSYALTPSGEALRGVFGRLEAWCLAHHEAPPACDGPPPPDHEPPFLQILNILQEKWAMPIMGQLVNGPLGFNELGRLAGGVNATTLGQRLDRLEGFGLIEKTVLSDFPPRHTYALTASGRDFGTVLDAIAAWGEAHLPDDLSKRGAP